MSTKTTRIISLILMILPSAMLTMSAVMKLIHAPAIVEGFNKSALGNHLILIGIIELVSVALFLIPKTTKVGFLLLCSYLGGAIAVELAGGQPPTAAIFLAIIWISVYLKDKLIFIQTPKAGVIN
mgnify:CR=1 FL=1